MAVHNLYTVAVSGRPCVLSSDGFEGGYWVIVVLEKRIIQHILETATDNITVAVEFPCNPSDPVSLSFFHSSHFLRSPYHFNFDLSAFSLSASVYSSVVFNDLQ